MTPLERKWEKRLESDGMPASLPHSNQRCERGKGVIEQFVKTSLADSAIYLKWTRLTHLVNALPAYFHNRHLLITLCETGYVIKTARQHKVNRATVYRAMHALERWSRERTT